MRFQGQSTAGIVPIPPSPGMSAPSSLPASVLNTTVLKQTSGQTGSLVSGPTEIQIHTLIISWSGVDIPGELNFTGENYQEVLSLDISGSSGTIPLSFDPPMPVSLGTNGLAVTNNSSGGRYNVTIYYSTVRP